MIERPRVRVPAGAAGEFSPPGSISFLCRLLFRHRVTAVAHKRS